jgi:hypothetical protein
MKIAEPLSPRMAELKTEFDQALAEERAAGSESWRREWQALVDTVHAIVKDPVTTVADFNLKVEAWEAIIREPSYDSEDVSGQYGWQDRVPFRLIADARKLLDPGGRVS